MEVGLLPPFVRDAVSELYYQPWQFDYDIDY